MMKRIVSMLLCVLLVLSLLPVGTLAAQNTEDIIILYENDPHCVVEGYSKLSAMKKELQESYAHVGVVSGGDYIRGNSLGAASQGGYIVELMNLVGYDAATLGNHEFGYRLERLDELVGQMDTKPVCCNFEKLGAGETYYEPYSIVSYGDVDVAYIGIVTPSTISSSVPVQFKNENGEHIYTFHSTDLYEVVQKNIDSAKAAGAEYVVALSHIGYGDDALYPDVEDVETLIANTDGFDVVLDAHSHTVIEGKVLTDKGGNRVLLSSTGTKFEYIGKLTISDGEFKTELLKTEEYKKTDPVVDAYIEKIYEEYSVVGERKIGLSEINLITQDENGKRLVRNTETNLGDLCADAIRTVMDADISYINGGGLRADLSAGAITFNDVLSVLPFNNTIVLAEISGQTIKDMLEMTMRNWPKEEGCFPHVAGITFAFDTDRPSSVVLNEQEEFVSVDGPYRVYDLKVLNRETGKYEPLEETRTYTIASHNYALLEQGSGLKMLENVKILQDDGLLDVEALERYIVEDLGGKIDRTYRHMVPNITFTDAESCSASKACPLCRYTDLDKTATYHDGVHYCVEEGLMEGIGNNCFAPNSAATRAQIAAILWRMEGEPKVEIAEGFNDVYAFEWYNDAIRWVTAKGIAEGYGDSVFGPNDAVTREQLATILWRYCKYKGYDVSVGENTNILSYGDAFDIAEYAISAMQWACGSGMIRGVAQDNTMVLQPQGNVLRSRIASVVYRFCTEIAKTAK